MSEQESRNRGPILAEYLEEPEAAQELRVSVRSLQRWRASRTGPPFLILGAANACAAVVRILTDEVVEVEAAA